MNAASKIQAASDAIEALLDSEDIAVSSDAGDYLVGVQTTLFEARKIAEAPVVHLTVNVTDLSAFREAWNQFSNVSIDDNDDTEEPFRHFPAGTDRLAIWAWFEQAFDVTLGVGDIQPTDIVTLDRRQLAAVLAGLRLVQAEIPRGEFLPQGVQMIFDAEGTIEPLSEDEIDELCETINC